MLLRSYISLILLALVLLVAAASAETATPVASAAARHLLQSGSGMINVHERHGQETYYAAASNRLNRVTFTHQSNSPKFTVSTNGGRSHRGVVVKDPMVSHSFKLVVQGRRYVLGSPSILVQLNNNDSPIAVYIAAPKMGSGKVAEQTIIATYMALSTELINLYTEWTGVLIAGGEVTEFPRLTDWTVIRIAFQNAFVTLNKILEVQSREQVGQTQNSLLAMGVSATHTYNRLNYWHNKMHKHEVSELDTEEVNAWSTMQMRQAIFGNDGMNRARKSIYADVNSGSWSSRIDRDNLNRSQGNNMKWMNSISEVMPNSRMEKELANAGHDGAKTITDEIFGAIDKRIAETSGRGGNPMYNTITSNSQEWQWFAGDETRRLMEVKNELRRMDITNKLSKGIYSELISTPWVKSAVLGLDNAQVGAEQWASVKEKQITEWAKNTGNYLKNLVGGGKVVESINAEVHAEGGMQPGDPELAKSAYAAAHAKKMKNMQELEQKVANPAESTETIESKNPRNPSQKYVKTFRFRIKPKFNLGTNFLKRVAITTDLTFVKANMIHHFDFDVTVHDPMSKDPKAEMTLAYKGANAKGYSWGTTAYAVVNAVARDDFNGAKWNPYQNADQTDAKTNHALLSAFVRYKKDGIDTGVFVALKVPFGVSKSGKVTQGIVTRVSPYFKYTFASQRTTIGIKADVFVHENDGFKYNVLGKISHEFANGWYGDVNMGVRGSEEGSMSFGELAVRRNFDLGSSGATGHVEIFGGVRHNAGYNDYDNSANHNFGQKKTEGMIGIRVGIKF